MKKTLLIGCLVSSVLSVAATTGSVNFTNETDTKVTDLTKSGIKSGIKSTDLKDKLEAKLAIGKNFEVGAMISNKTAFDALKVNKETLMAKDEEPTLWFKVGDKNFFKALIRPTKTDVVRMFDPSTELEKFDLSNVDDKDKVYNNLVKLTKLGIFHVEAPKKNGDNTEYPDNVNFEDFLKGTKNENVSYPKYVKEKDAKYVLRPTLQLHLEKSLDDLKFAADAKSSFNITKDVMNKNLALGFSVDKKELDGVKNPGLKLGLGFKDMLIEDSENPYKTKFGLRDITGSMSMSYDVNKELNLKLGNEYRFTISNLRNNGDIDSLKTKEDAKVKQVNEGLELYSHKPDNWNEFSKAWNDFYQDYKSYSAYSRIASLVSIEGTFHEGNIDNSEYKRLVLFSRFLSNRKQSNVPKISLETRYTDIQNGENLLKIYNTEDELAKLWLSHYKPVFENYRADLGVMPDVLDYKFNLGKFNEKYFGTATYKFGENLNLVGKLGIQHSYFYDNNDYEEHIVAPTLEADSNINYKGFSFNTKVKFGYALVLRSDQTNNLYELAVNPKLTTSYAFDLGKGFKLTPSLSGDCLFVKRNDAVKYVIKNIDNEADQNTEAQTIKPDYLVKEYALARSIKATITPAISMEYNGDKGFMLGLTVENPFNFSNYGYSITDYFKDHLNDKPLTYDMYLNDSKTNALRFVDTHFKTSFKLGYQW